MSSPSRTRPTREETIARLFAAAAEVFEERGVAAASVEQIAAAAGFTRGAFYSNFETKDDLVLAMIEDHVRRSMERNLALLVEHPDTVSFVQAMAAAEDPDDDPLHTSPVLHAELILYAARKPEHRPALARRLQHMRVLIGDIVISTLDAAGVAHPFTAEEAGGLLLAIEDGLRLHRLIDPESTPPDAFIQAVQALQGLLLASGGGSAWRGGGEADGP